MFTATRRPAITTDLPDGYEVRKTGQGQVYFYHVPTGISTWYDPRIPRDLRETPMPGSLPPGWEMRHTPSGRIYFVDRKPTDPDCPLSQQCLLIIKKNSSGFFYKTDNNRTTQFTDPRLSSSGLALQNLLK